ncbi:MAG: serine/threonine protein kinase [Alphaproteobacteria bacterium]|nr:serine/threonine protein kinase [Alphaproteobacteria bacterium]MCB9691104.1 serine/threonine protein kinase [Alphaproteobacteria bacterium]
MVQATRVGDPGRGLALKVLREGASDPRQCARAANEAATLRQLRHPNLLHVHRLLDYHGRVVVESELVDGVGLDRALRAGRLTPQDAVAVALQVAIALDAAFATPSPVDGRPLEVVHRDLKPGNVLLTRGGTVKVVDFGMACSRLTPLEAGELRGTPGYSPPQPLTGADLPAVDIYALGLVLFECLVGLPLVVTRNPERHDDQVAEGLARIVELDLPAGVGPALVSLLRSMMRFDPMERPLLVDAVARLAQIALHPDMDGDLAALAAARIPDRSFFAPNEHDEWESVAFLERELPDIPTPVRPARDVEKEVRARLKEPTWMDDLPGLRALLASADGRVEAPLLDLLRPRGWQFWRRPIRPEELEGALLLLAVDPSPDAILRARALRESRDVRVAEAARRVLIGM